MDIASLIHSYGYLAVAAGTFLEGETVLLAAGAVAFHGYLSPPLVVVVAALSGFAGDQIYFHAGRRYGTALLSRFPSMQPRAARVTGLLERYNVPVILIIRFLYGLRVIGPIVIGMSNVSWVRFLILNLVGAFIWATVITSVGYGLGQGLMYARAYLDLDKVWILAALGFSCIIVWLILK